MNFNLSEILSVTMVLFAVIDILGDIPIIVGLREKVGHIQSEKASILAFVIMVAFLFFGNKILRLLGVDVNSFAVAGSFVIFSSRWKWFWVYPYLEKKRQHQRVSFRSLSH